MADETPHKLAIDSTHLSWLAGFLGLHALSEEISPDSLKGHLQGLELRAYPDGAFLLKEGEGTNELYISYKGKVMVFKGDKKVAELQPGTFFGEIAFLLDRSRTATLRAGTGCEAFRIPAVVFKGFIGKFPALRDSLRRLAESRMGDVPED